MLKQGCNPPLRPKRTCTTHTKRRNVLLAFVAARRGLPLHMWFLLFCIPCDPFPDVVSALNARFRAGTPSDEPASAGVVLHGLNGQLGMEPSPWLSVASLVRRDKSGRVSCFVANARLPFLYHGAQRGGSSSLQTPGFVMRPSVVKRALLCAYPYDGNTDGKTCAPNWRETASPNKCTPGCPSETKWKRKHPGFSAKNGSVVGLNLSQAMFLHEDRVAQLSASMPSDEVRRYDENLERARLVMQQQHHQYNVCPSRGLSSVSRSLGSLALSLSRSLVSLSHASSPHRGRRSCLLRTRATRFCLILSRLFTCSRTQPSRTPS